MKDKEHLTFISYLETLHQSGLIALGKEPNPMDGATEFSAEDLETILELVEIMRDKTRGNLTDQETRALNAVRDRLISGYNENLNNDYNLPFYNEDEEGARVEIH